MRNGQSSTCQIYRGQGALSMTQLIFAGSSDSKQKKKHENSIGFSEVLRPVLELPISIYQEDLKTKK